MIFAQARGGRKVSGHGLLCFWELTAVKKLDALDTRAGPSSNVAVLGVAPGLL